MTDDRDRLRETLLILIGGDRTTRHTLSGGVEQLLRHRIEMDSPGRRCSAVARVRSRMLRGPRP